MLDLAEPLEVTRRIQYGGRADDVTVYVDPPDEAWLGEVAEALRLEGEDQAAAFARLNAPERLAPFVAGWSGVGRAGAETGRTEDWDRGAPRRR